MTTVRALHTNGGRLADAESLSAYAAGVRARLAAMREMEALEHAAVERTVERLRAAYPQFGQYHALGWEKGYRDLRLFLMYMTRSMFLGDVALLDEQVLVWARTMLKSFNFTPKFLRDGFTYLRDAVRDGSRAETFALMEPVLNHAVAFMSDIPEPARAEV